MLIILIGPPGSGKGTQGQFLAKELKLPHVSIGEVFRKVSDQNNESSVLLNNYMKQGKLVPAHIANEIVKEFLSSKMYQAGYILDGYPRSIEQAQFLNHINDQPKHVIYFEINENLIFKRIMARLNCNNCNMSFSNDITDVTQNVCSNCGAADFFLRNDDNQEVIGERIKTYNKETYPLIEYYKNIGNNFHVVDANLTKEEVSTQLANILKNI
ncbi:MAG: adenylate kinase [Rickettsiaceae bacterium]|nr:MAG: adenylate kinase [Rickettsiaceae bacterium]